ncbi:MAG: hypothetical protein EOP11_13885, partial [Proteobacteria bacterium]
TSHDYRSLDGRLLSNMQTYLTDAVIAPEWPEFIYVHLVGVDGTAHRFGVGSKATKAYLRWLDARMGAVLRTLRAGEAKGYQVITLLTADHGMLDPAAFSDAATLFKRPGIILTNESRYLGLHTKQPATLRRSLEDARGLASVELTVLRDGEDLYLNSDNRQLQFRYGPPVCAEESYSLAQVSGSAVSPLQCPSAFDALVPPYPYFVANVATYLHAKYHPDALVIAKPRYSFMNVAKGMRGAHGGPTADEVLVPLLTRNASVSGSRPMRTSDLLKILR